MVGLVCIDVDGTLVGPSGTVLPEVWTAAERARASGLQLAVCSGRPAFGLARSYAERLDAGGWHVFQNGASVFHLPSSASHSRSIPAEVLERLRERAHETGRILELYTDAGYAVESTADRAVRHAALLGVPFEQRDFDSLEGRIVRAQWLIALEETDAVVAESHDGLTLSPSLSPVMPDTSFINMTPQGVDKTSAVRILAEEYGMPLDRVMMIGDGNNDVGPMSIVGYPVAMGNAEPDVFKVARYTVGHVEDGGLLEAFDLAMRLFGVAEGAELPLRGELQSSAG